MLSETGGTVPPRDRSPSVDNAPRASASRGFGSRWTPARRLGLAGLWALLLLGTVLFLARMQPWQGLQLRWDAQAGGAVVVSARGPAAAIPPGTVLRQLGPAAALAPQAQREGVEQGPDQGPDRAPRQLPMPVLVLEPADLAIEPATDLPNLRAYDAFLARQDQVATWLRAGAVRWHSADGRTWDVVPAPQRPWGDFPADFWVQLVVGLLAWTIAAGVWSFRSADPAARYLLVCGFCTLLFAPLAAVYSTRELALPSLQFRLLCDFNFFGGAMYAGAMMALLWYYPRRLGRPALGPPLLALYAAWWLAQELRWIDDMVLARRSLVFVALLGTLVLATVQWRRSRADPVARAALQWFLLSWVVGISLFCSLIFVPQLFGVSTAALQGYGFLLILLVYAGLAFGILRYRLFELGEWWFRVLLWLLVAALFVVMDLALVLVLQPVVSASIALLVCGFLWLPLRGWLWGRLAGGAHLAPQQLFERVLEVSLAPSQPERQRRGRALLETLFRPLEIAAGAAVPQVTVADDGLAMHLPALQDGPPLVLRFPGHGRRLFTPRDRSLAQQVHDLLVQADANRDAWHRGALAERGRIARDLHDDIGARLLSSLHQPDLQQTRQTVQHAVAEMRTIIDGLGGRQMALDELVAEMRHETALRLEVAGITLDWPLPPPAQATVQLPYHAWRNAISMLRELVSNVLRHAQARRVAVQVDCRDGALHLAVRDDGCGMPAAPRAGHGLDNLRRRVAGLGGQLHIGAGIEGGEGTGVALSIPLADGMAADAAAATAPAATAASVANADATAAADADADADADPAEASATPPSPRDTPSATTLQATAENAP
jgi:two-component system sensor histidine kinase DevS